MASHPANPAGPGRGALYLLIALVAYLVVPVGLYTAIGAGDPDRLRLIHYVVASSYLVTTVMMLVEAGAAVPRRPAPVPVEEARDEVPLVTVIIAAYLPNEQHVIVESLVWLSTRMNQPTDRLQIILAYNTPTDLPVEDALESFRHLNVAFTPLRVAGSTSKVENVRAALPMARGEMTVLLDADHHLLPDAIERAYRWIAGGYDVVQGRCVIRYQKRDLLSRYVAVEFEHTYAVAHAGRSLRTDTAIFAGTNGYWRTSVLQELSLDVRMLTEDIDATLRALLAGYRLVHDRSVVSSELAPGSLRAWWYQRLRWAQGWFQCTLRHQRAVWSSPILTSGRKLYWTYLLLWRELFPFLSLQVFALLITGRVLGYHIDWTGDPYLLGTAVVTLAAGPLTSLTAYRVALWRTKKRLKGWFVLYAVTNLLYITAKNMVAMVAVVRELFGERAWIVTGRATPSDPTPKRSGEPGRSPARSGRGGT